MNCSRDCGICAGSGGWERSGMPPGRFMPERRDDMSIDGADALLLLLLLSPLLSDPPRGIVFHDVGAFDGMLV